MSNETIPELKVYYCNRETVCCDCEEAINKGDLFFIDQGSQHFCLSCADLDQLIYLPSGNTALTRRASKLSKLVAVVYRFSSSRKRNERKGLLVEEEALQKAQEECLSDEDVREKHRERDAKRRVLLDSQYLKDFALRIREFYPQCPEGREYQIAEHACLKYSGRVGRSASAKEFENSTIILAVRAHVRHLETDYDLLLMNGNDRNDARKTIEDDIESVLRNWQTAKE